MSEIAFLSALHVELTRHDQPGAARHDHELFQTSTIAALLAGAFDGDVTVGELLEHGDMGLGTLNGLDGELIVVDGEAFKAQLDGTLIRPDSSSRTPYAVVVPFMPGAGMALRAPFADADLERRLAEAVGEAGRPTAIRIVGRFASVRVRSVPRQEPPYPPLAQAIAEQQVTDLTEVAGTMVGFSFPDELDGIEMVGTHLHFVTDDRAMGGHVLSFSLHDGVAHLDVGTDLHVELPPAVGSPRHGAMLDQEALRRLETDVDGEAVCR